MTTHSGPGVDTIIKEYFPEYERHIRSYKSDLSRRKSFQDEFEELMDSIVPKNLVELEECYNTHATSFIGDLNKIRIQGGNCAMYIDDSSVIKIRYAEHSDSLVNEITVMQYLTSIDSTLFPKFQEYGLLEKDDNLYNKILELANNKINAMELIRRPSSFTKYYQFLKMAKIQGTHLHNTIVNDILHEKNDAQSSKDLDQLLQDVAGALSIYLELAKEHGITHNDMHLGNIMCHRKNGIFDIKIIDFGRMHIKDLDLQKYSETYQKVCLPVPNNKQVTSKYHIEHDSGYLLDLATVSLSVLIYMEFDWPDFILLAENDKEDLFLIINPNAISIEKPNYIFKPFYYGLATLACLIYAWYENYNKKYTMMKSYEKDDGVLIVPISDLYDYDKLEPLLCPCKTLIKPTFEQIRNRFNNNMKQFKTNLEKIDIFKKQGGHTSIKRRAPRKSRKMTGSGFTPELPDGLTLVSRNPTEDPNKKAARLRRIAEKYGSIESPQDLAYRLLRDKALAKYSAPTSKFSPQPMNSYYHPIPKPVNVGGKPPKQYKIYTEPDTKRRYLRHNNSRWYLDEHRGKYRYAKDTSHVIVRAFS